MNTDELFNRAKKCRKLAEQVNDLRVKDTYLAAARAWESMAHRQVSALMPPPPSDPSQRRQRAS
jgi:hypothetical protein